MSHASNGQQTSMNTTPAIGIEGMLASTVAKQIDTYPNGHTAELAPGAVVVHNASGECLPPTTGFTASTIAGIVAHSHTGNMGTTGYKVDAPVPVLARGQIVVKPETAVALSDGVYISATSFRLTNVSTGNISLTGAARWRTSTSAANSLAVLEIDVTNRQA